MTDSDTAPNTRRLVLKPLPLLLRFELDRATPVIVYLIEVYSARERFFKIGYTSEPKIAHRHPRDGTLAVHYHWREVDQVTVHGFMEAEKLEADLLNHPTLAPYRYRPHHWFDGYTECLCCSDALVRQVFTETCEHFQEEAAFLRAIWPY